MGTERISIKVTRDGAKATRKEIEGIGTGADKASKGLDGVSTALKAVAAVAFGRAVKETISLADAYTDLTNKVRFATRGEQEMASVRDELFRSANQNRASVDAVADTYSKLKLATGALGLSQREVIDLTDTLSKATVLSGASADNAANALRQLGQGMASGALRGDELNSILENTPYIAQVIAESLGKDIGAIRQMGAEGKITGKIIADAFKGAREEIVDRFGQRVPKVSEALTVAGNVLMRLTGVVDEATGSSKGLAETIISIAKAVDEMIPQIADLAVELTNISELKGALDDLFPDINGSGIGVLQFMTLMFSTMEDRIIGIARAASKMWAALSFGMEEMPDGSLLADLGDILTGQGDVTARVLATIDAQRNQRQGVTTVNDDPNDPNNTLNRKGKNTTRAAIEKPKGESFESIINGLERENALLQMGNDERAVTEGYIRAFEAAQGNLTVGQLDQIEAQLRKNQAIEIEKRTLDEVEERLGKQLELELELMKAEDETRQVYEDILSDLETQRRLTFMGNEEREIALGLIDAQHAAQGRLNDEQMKTIEAQLRLNQRLAPSQMPSDFEGSMRFMDQEFLANVHTLGQELAEIFGPGGTLQQGLHGVVGSLSDVIGHSIAFGDSWDDTVEAIKNVGRSIIAEIISSLIRIPIQMAINEAIASGLRAKATAETVAQAGVITGSMAPAAAATSLATAGTNSAGATAAIVGVAALAAGVLAGAALFEEGGYTGNGGRSAVAGLVHGQEYVLNADATRRYRGHLDAMNEGRWRPPSGGGGGGMQVSIINQAGGVEFDTRRVDEAHIEIIARRVAAQVAPDAVARDLQSPQSKTGRALTNNYSTTRKRG